AEEHHEVHLARGLRDAGDELGTHRPLAVQPRELVGCRVCLVENERRAAREVARVAFARYREALHRNAVDLRGTGRVFVLPRQVVAGARGQHAHVGTSCQMFGDIPRVQLRSAADILGVALHDEGELHLSDGSAEGGVTSIAEGASTAPAAGSGVDTAGADAGSSSTGGAAAANGAGSCTTGSGAAGVLTNGCGASAVADVSDGAAGSAASKASPPSPSGPSSNASSSPSGASAMGCAGAAPPAPIASLPGNVPRRPRRRRRRRRLPSADPSAPAPVVSAGGRGDGLDDDGVGASNVRDGTAGGGAGTASSPRMRRSVKSARVASDSTRSARPCISRLTRDTSVTSRWSTV